MAFIKKTWKDRLVEYAGRRKITNVTTLAAQIVDVERSEGAVSEEGTAINAANMNDLEQRTADAFSSVQQDIEGINSDLAGYKFGTTSDGKPGYIMPGGADTVIPFNQFKISRIDTGTGNGNVNQSYNNVYIPGKTKITVGHAGIVDTSHYNLIMEFAIYDGDGKQLYTTTTPADNITVTVDTPTTFRVYLYGWQTYATDITAI